MKTTARKIPKRKFNQKIALPIVAIAIIISFFTLSVLSMHLTGEDILHKVVATGQPITETIAKTYNSIPRIGELYQRSAIPFFSYTTTFGSDLLLRTVDIILCFVAIYICTAVIIGRRAKLKLQDSIILLFSFIALVCYNSSEIFTMRFSYLHNYIPIIILVSAVLYILIRQKTYSKRILLGDLLVATLCAMSNEIAPIAFVLIVFMLLIINAKNDKNKKTRNRLIAVLIGLCLGLFYLLGNGSMLRRMAGSYGAAYDYVSYFKIFSAPLYTISKSCLHIMYNIRHLFLLFVILTVSIIFQYKKKKIKLAKNQFICLTFSALYVLGSSQIKILDDMESRLLSPAYLGLIIGIGMLIPQYLRIAKKNNKQFPAIIYASLLIMSIAAVMDMAILRTSENMLYADTFEAIESTSENSFCVSMQDLGNTKESKLYVFKTFSPFEGWTSNYTTIKIYDKSMRYEYVCK